ncbi:MAG: EAL domain-containing protein [Deltaproteobacteria bacterium]|nr:EAL domain-containing protein [Deltaproteobacteria bacterium]
MSRFGLRVRFLATLLALIVGLQAATSLVVLERTRREAESHARAQLEAGGRVFERLLGERERQLAANVSVLVADFGLRRAVATRDQPTVASALENHGARIRTDLAFLIARDGQLEAVTPPGVALDVEDTDLRALLEQAKRTGRASGIGFVSGHPHQIVLAPVNAPLLIGWIGMGFELDRELASDLRQLTGLEVSFWSARSDADAIRLESTLPPGDQAGLAEALAGRRRSAASMDAVPDADAAAWFSLPVAIASGDDEHVGAVLQTSRALALAAYAAQRSDLIRFFGAGLVLALGVAMWTARRLTRPIGALADAAASISAGDLQAPVDVGDRQDEIGRLAESFRVMQQALGERERRILHDTLHDRLTGLPNRNAAPAALADRLARGGELVVLLLDVVRLKDINDNLGNSIGDEILIGSAERLRRANAVEWAARVGGDEFLVLLPGGDEDRVSRTVLQLVAELEAPHEVRGARIVPRFRAGLAFAPRDGDDAEVLMRRAEMAVALAKADRTNRACYAKGLEESNHRRVGILIELERALEAGELELHYQPKVSMRTARVIGAEALIRWRHARMGQMNPQEFIGIAEQAGLIGRISEWVLDRAVRQAAQWSVRGIDLNLSINLSADDAASDVLPERIAAVLNAHGARPEHLRIEVTESVVMTDPARVARLLTRVRDRGVGIAIDDFGTGHSSLAQLQTLPCDELKIDQTFVRGLRAGTANAVIVRTTIEMAHSLGLHVVAEGVEDRPSWNLLAQYGCDVAQGYFLGRPMPPADFLAWLDRFAKEGIDG